MLPIDWAAPASSVLRRLSDRRVRQYWDPNHLLAGQMKTDARAPQPVQDCCTRSGILWDLAAVYRPGVIWSDRMPPATVFNGPVVHVTDAIEDALGPDRAAARVGSTPSAEPSTKGLVFLTHGGCANTTVMRRNVDAALKSLGLPSRYDVVDQDTLPESDLRRGYPTPTLLAAQAHTRHVPVVVVTGATEPLDFLDVACVLRKPTSPEELLAAVRRCIASGDAATS
jgi:CheY-like chemotaxis protein